MPRVNGVLSKDAGDVWPAVSLLIKPCLDLVDTGYSLDDLLAEIKLCRKQLWIIDGGLAAGITSIQVLPQWKKLTVEYLGGSDMPSWYGDWYDEMQRFAEAHGCKYIEVRGREGWARLARSQGAEVTTMTVSRKLVYGR